MNEEIKKYSEIQNIAIYVLQEIKNYIGKGVTEKDIATKCTSLLKKAGIVDCWYHGVAALVLVGERTILSISGRDYSATDIAVKDNDLITIDLSPKKNDYWGDCARSYIVESEKITDTPNSLEFTKGLAAEKHLHNFIKEIAKPEMIIDDLYQEANREIIKLGYKNLDFRGNIGHSIERHINDRRYIERGNKSILGDLPLFTFEPHIVAKNSKFGFKHENIYYFENAKIKVLGNASI